MLISEEDAQKFYQLPPGTYIRLLEHFAALVTEHLSLSKAGKTFLADLMDKSKLSQLPAFAKVWDNIKFLKEHYAKEKEKLGPALTAIGKFFYNVSPVITEPPNDFKPGEDILGYYKKTKTITGMLKQPEVKKGLIFLDEKFGEKISKVIETHIGKFANECDLAIVDIQKSRPWSTTIDRWKRSFDWTSTDPVFAKEVERADQISSLENEWFSLSISSISFAISMAKFITDIEESDIKDYLSLLGDLFGIMESAANSVAKNISVQGGNAANAKAAAKTLGIIGAILGAAVYAWDLSKSIERRDLEEISFNLIGIGIGAGSVYATIIGATFALSILGVAGIILAVIMGVTADHPLITYLEDTEWGRNKNRIIDVNKSIREFYKRMYQFRIIFVGFSKKKEWGYLQIQSMAMSDSTRIRLGCKDGNTYLPEKQAKPGEKDIEGRGEIIKVAGSWLEKNAFLPKTIRIYRLYEVWPQIISTPMKKFELSAGIDMDVTGGKIDQLVLNDKTKIWFD